MSSIRLTGGNVSLIMSILQWPALNNITTNNIIRRITLFVHKNRYKRTKNIKLL